MSFIKIILEGDDIKENLLNYRLNCIVLLSYEPMPASRLA